MNVEEARTNQIATEIREIVAQYNQEVSRERKSWPISVKGRVLEMKSQGHKWKTISELTGIPYYTLLNWRHRKLKGSVCSGKFQAVTVTDTHANMSRDISVNAPRSVTVTVAGKVKIEGLEFRELLTVLKRLKQ